MRNNLEDDLLEKYIRSAGEKAKLDARIHGTYTVFMDEKGVIVKEYPDGRREPINENYE